MIPVVAFSRFYYEDFMRRHRLDRQYFQYVADPDQLRGWDRGTPLLAIGNWYSRDDLFEEIERARQRGMQLIEVTS